MFRVTLAFRYADIAANIGANHWCQYVSGYIAFRYADMPILLPILLPILVPILVPIPANKKVGASKCTDKDREGGQGNESDNGQSS